MVLYATLLCIEGDEISSGEWNLTDNELVNRLLASKIDDVVATTKRWLTGEYWLSAPLLWMTGVRPEYRDLRHYSQVASKALGRPCFAYGIKDKRKRKLSIKLTTGEYVTLGDSPTQWLFGLTSQLSKAFTARELEQATDLLRQQFRTEVISLAKPGDGTGDSEQMCLL
jgi:hypothetical protein